jgi:hypothetical protein
MVFSAVELDSLSTAPGVWPDQRAAANGSAGDCRWPQAEDIGRNEAE